MTYPPIYEAIILSICPECNSFPDAWSQHFRAQRSAMYTPSPFSPAPALFDTAVKFVTSFRFARAPIRVSSGPGQPMRTQTKPTHPTNLVFRSDRNLTIVQVSQCEPGDSGNERTSAQQDIAGLHIPHRLVNRVPYFRLVGDRQFCLRTTSTIAPHAQPHKDSYRRATNAARHRRPRR